MSDKGHIVYKQNRRTVQQKYRGKTKNVKNNKLTKRNFKQTNERLTRPHNITIPKYTTNAWLPSNNKNSQKLRSILWPQYNLSLVRQP